MRRGERRARERRARRRSLKGTLDQAARTWDGPDDYRQRLAGRRPSSEDESEPDRPTPRRP
jgi:hypothetical protein